jgi:hypothetical protein
MRRLSGINNRSVCYEIQIGVGLETGIGIDRPCRFRFRSLTKTGTNWFVGLLFLRLPIKKGTDRSNKLSTKQTHWIFVIGIQI